MSKKRPEPFWRSERNCWFVQIGKRQHRLSPDEAEAWRLYHELMAKPLEARTAPTASIPTRVVEILDVFLDWTSRNKAARTYERYRENIQRLVSRLPAMIAVADFRPYHVTGPWMISRTGRTIPRTTSSARSSGRFTGPWTRS